MPAKKKKANQQQLQTQRAPQRQLSPVLLFSKRARTWIVAACSIAIICFVMLPLGLDRLSSANTQEAAAYQAADAAAPTPAPEAAAALPATAEPEAATPAPTQEMRVSEYSTLREGDRYPAVLELHARLVSLGYLESDEPSETYNEATASAVALFQRTLNLDMTGVADSQLQEQLFSTDAAPYEAKLGDDGADVRSMQSRLAQLGYYEEKVNGYFGVATEEALRAFQLKNELNADGVYGMDERELIYSADARPAVDPTPTPAPTPKATKKPAATKAPAKTDAPDEPDEPDEPSAPAEPDEPDEPDVPVVPDEPDEGGDGGSSLPVVPDEPEPDEGGSSGGGSGSYGSGINGMIACAEDQIGKRYVLGDEGPNTFDCSGLVYYCLTKAGVSTTRFSAASFAKVEKWTLISSMDDLKRGDLLFFTDDGASRVTHTGIYIGGGTMIDASSSNGKVVKRSCTTAYWTRNFVCARRVF